MANGSDVQEHESVVHSTIVLLVFITQINVK